MHPLIAHEMVRAMQRELEERVGRPRRPVPVRRIRVRRKKH